METLLRIGLSNAAAALLLALAIVAVACVWRRPAVLHALWLVVLVKLLTPPLVWLPEPWAADAASGPAAAPAVVDSPTISLAEAALPPAEATDPVPVPLPVPVPNSGEASGTGGGTGTEDQPLAPPAVAAPAAAPTPATPWWVTALAGAWLAGAAAWYALALWRLGRFRCLLRHAVPAPESLRQRARKLAERMALRRCPAVWLVPGRVSPMLWAAGGRPRVLFPADLLGRTDTDQQNALLVHELAHLRRRDHWVRWLEFVAAGLHWWNPVLWLARRELREAEEQCCDAWVTSTLPGAGKAYASALLETLDFLSDAPPAAPLLASGVGRVSDLKRRLTMIMRGTTPRAMGWRGGLAVAGLGALLLAGLPAWARAQQEAKPGPKPDAEFVHFFLAGDDPATNVDAEKANAALKELEAQLAKKQAEVQDLAAKIQAIRAKLAAAKGAPADAGAGERRIVVEADANVKYESLKGLLEQLRATQADGKPVRVIVLDKGSGKIIMEANPGGATPPAAGEVPAAARFILRMADGNPQKWFVVPATPAAGAPATPGADADKRIDELEQKLKAILGEVEQLRQQRKEAPKKDGDTKEESDSRPSIEKFLYLKQLSRAADATAEEQSKQAVVLRDRLFALQDAAKKGQAEREEAAARLQATREQLAALAKDSDARLSDGRAAALQVEAAVREAEARLAKVQAVVKDPNEVKAAAAELEARRAQLEQARATLEKQAEDGKVRQANLQAHVQACEAQLKAAEATLKRIEEVMHELQPEGDAAPKK